MKKISNLKKVFSPSSSKAIPDKPDTLQSPAKQVSAFGKVIAGLSSLGKAGKASKTIDNSEPEFNQVENVKRNLILDTLKLHAWAASESSDDQRRMWFSQMAGGKWNVGTQIDNWYNESSQDTLGLNLNGARMKSFHISVNTLMSKLAELSSAYYSNPDTLELKAMPSASGSSGDKRTLKETSDALRDVINKLDAISDVKEPREDIGWLKVNLKNAQHRLEELLNID